MTHATSDRCHVVGAWLGTLPLPEPSSVAIYAELNPTVCWQDINADTARHVIATIGGDWTVHTYDDPQTIAAQSVDHLGTTISVTVVVPGVNLPDLAADATRLADAPPAGRISDIIAANEAARMDPDTVDWAEPAKRVEP